jgi:hypothetical protein
MNKLKAIVFASVLVLGTSANATDVNEVKDELVKQKDMLVGHISVKVEETKAYQVKAWAEGKEQLKNNWITIKSWFIKDEEVE